MCSKVRRMAVLSVHEAESLIFRNLSIDILILSLANGLAWPSLRRLP